MYKLSNVMMSEGGISNSLRAALDVFETERPGEPLATSEVASNLDVSHRTTYKRLNQLAERGFLETKKVGAKGRIWWRPTTHSKNRVETPDRSVSRDGSTAINRVPEPDTVSGATDGDGFSTGMLRDVSERKQREHRLEQYEQLVETLEDGIYALDGDGRYTLVNEAFCELTGYDREALLGSHASLVYDDDRAPEVQSMAAEIADGERDLGIIELDILTRGGDAIPCEVRFDLFSIDDGTGRCGVVRNISERKNRERQLARFKQAVEASGHAIYMADENARITYVNSAFEEMTGYTAAEAVASRPSILSSGSHDAEYYNDLWKTVEEGRVWEEEIVDRRKDGTLYYAEQTVAPVTDEDGDIVQFVAVQKDITGRKEFEERLTRLNEASRELLTAETRVGAVLVETVTDLFDLPACAVYAYDDVTGRLEPTADSVVGDFSGEFSSVPADSRSLVGRIFQEGEARYYETLVESSSFRIGLDPTEMQTGSFVPLGDHGILIVGGREPLDEDTRQLIELLAANAEAAWNRVTHQQVLERRVRQQETVTALGQAALEAGDLDELMGEVVTAVANVLGNDYAKVLDLDDERDRLLLRQGVGWDEGIVGEATVSATDADSQAAYTLWTDEPVVVRDLQTETRFTGSNLLTSHDIRSGISVIIGPSDNPWGVLSTHDTTSREFSKHDANFVQSVANILATAIKRHNDEQVLVSQREELAALVSLNEVVREISDTVINQSTREEIESVVCERLAETDSYEFAWIGTVDHRSQTVEIAAEAGIDGYLDDVTITVDPDDEHGEGPTGRALRSGDIQTCHDIYDDSQYEPWRETAKEYGFRSSAAVPITRAGTTYGVLNLYANRRNAITGREKTVVEQLGEQVGHAIAAVERKRALMSDNVVELGFQIPDMFGMLDLDPAEGTISLADTVPVGDGTYVVYGSVTGDAGQRLSDIVDRLPHWESVEFRDAEDVDGERAFELRLTEPPVLSTVASVGGTITEAVIEDGRCHMTIQVPPGDGVRQVLNTVQEAYSDAEMVTRRQTTRGIGIDQNKILELSETLTDRQLAVLQAAYHAGFFKWPRDASGEEVAESLDVAAPTFHQHLRKAEQKVFDSILSMIA